MGLDEIRQKIDVIDTQMKELFLARMDLSAQVIAVKKENGGAVYVPEREKEVIEKRSAQVETEKLPEYQMFVRQVMAISRTYQYAQIADMAEELAVLPEGNGSIIIEASDEQGETQFYTMLDAAALADLSIEDISVTEQGENGTHYRYRMSGDFSRDLAKGAVLQMIKEMKKVQILPK